MHGHHQTTRRVRRGFTLLELTVVVLILGITLAVAGPKMFGTAGDAREISARQNLSFIRDAIEMFRSRQGAYPGQSGGETGLKQDLETVMRSPFPMCTAGNQNAEIRVTNSSVSLSASGSQGWAYSTASGEFIINHAKYSSW